MKHTKKLIPAIGMLLLSACMLVTSTFAWFSMNDTVSVNAMSVKAKGDQVYLQISSTADGFLDGANQTEIDIENEAVELLPVNVVKSVTGTTKTDYAGDGTLVWVTNIGESNTVGTASVEYKVVTTEANSDPSPYYYKNTCYVRLDPTAGATAATAPLKVASVTSNGTDTKDDTFHKCMSVLVVCTINNNSMGSVWEYDGANFTKKLGADTLSSGNFAAGTVAKIEIYVFFNGDNQYCTQANLAAAANGGYSVDVNFTVKATQNNGKGA